MRIFTYLFFLIIFFTFTNANSVVSDWSYGVESQIRLISPVTNSNNQKEIYLGLEYDDTLPTQPAVLGDELGILLEGVLDLIDDVIDDICTKVTYIVTPPGGMTGMNPANISTFQTRKTGIESLKQGIQDIMSTNTKLV